MSLIINACRLKFCATIDICCSWELKRPCCWSSFYCILSYGVYVKGSSVPWPRPCPLFTACFHCYFLCWCFPGISGFSEVKGLSLYSPPTKLTNLPFILKSNLFFLLLCLGWVLWLISYQNQLWLDSWEVLPLLFHFSNSKVCLVSFTSLIRWALSVSWNQFLEKHQRYS